MLTFDDMPHCAIGRLRRVVRAPCLPSSAYSALHSPRTRLVDRRVLVGGTRAYSSPPRAFQPSWRTSNDALCTIFLRRLPWRSPVWDTGVGGPDFVPGFVRKHIAFWDYVILEEHPLRDTLASNLRDGKDMHDVLID